MTPEAVLNAAQGWRWSEDDYLHCAQVMLDHIMKSRMRKRAGTCVICGGDKVLPNGKRCTGCR